jgi:hypothetical protein
LPHNATCPRNISVRVGEDAQDCGFGIAIVEEIAADQVPQADDFTFTDGRQGRNALINLRTTALRLDTFGALAVSSQTSWVVRCQQAGKVSRMHVATSLVWGKSAIEKGGRLAVGQEGATRGELQGAVSGVCRVQVPCAKIGEHLRALPLLVPALLLALLLRALDRLALLIAGEHWHVQSTQGNAANRGQRLPP